MTVKYGILSQLMVKILLPKTITLFFHLKKLCSLSVSLAHYSLFKMENSQVLSNNNLLYT